MSIYVFSVLLLVIIIGVAFAAYIYYKIQKLSATIDGEDKNVNVSGSDNGDIAKLVRVFGWYNRIFILLIVLVIGMSVTLCMQYNGVKAVAESKVRVDSTGTVNDEPIDICFNRMESLDKTEILIDAIAEVESGNNPNCKGGGLMQITKVCIDAANKCQNQVKYEYTDRYSREKSIEVFNIIQKNFNKTGDLERAIRMWNGGPNYTVKATDGYYKKVMTVYNRKIDERLDKICRQYKTLNLY